jgi:lipid II:glycine glycyltransferase (peptidoglycan interpeptide bridge formation enzyme)
MDKLKYREFCRTNTELPVFSKDWWLDQVCGKDSWDVAVIENNGEIIASFPYFIKKKLFFKLLTMPPLTQRLGIWIKYPENQKNTTRLEFEKDIIQELIKKLPMFSFFKQNFNTSFSNWLPFYWDNFKQTVNYTYVIEDLKDHERVFSDFRQNVKTYIRKAEKILKVYESDDIEQFYKLNKLTFDRQKMRIPYSLEFLKKLDTACRDNNCRKIFFARDNESRIHGAVYIIWDKNCAFNLLSGIDPEFKNSGANSLLIWEAIKFASTVTGKYDFEGSMIESVERFFRAFGAVQKEIFNISKVNSRLLKIIFFLKDIFKS